MRKSDILHLEALALAATAGPWSFLNHNQEIGETPSPSDDWSILAEDGSVVCSEPNCVLKTLPAVCSGPYIAAVNPRVVLGLIAHLKRQYDTIKRQEERLKILESAAA